ncbi:MAG: methyltransferase [Paracoccaceae bacterium]
MSSDRLDLAVQAGALGDPLPPRIAVFRPRSGRDLSVLGTDRVHVVQGFRPDHDAFAGLGYAVSPSPEGPCDAAVVCVPRAKDEARALVAQAVALTGGGPVLVDGQKDDGIASLLKDCGKRVPIDGTLSKAHGKAFWFRGGDFDDWRPGAPDVLPGGFRTVPGVFSADAPDPGSLLLAEALPASLPRNVVDLGAGWGYLARAILDRRGVEKLHLVEAEHAALDCARANIDDPRAVFHWADATAFGPDRAYDAVVMNPPFHVGRATDVGTGQAFIATAARILKPSGRLWMVANRHLPYERHLRTLFAEVRDVGGDSRYKVFEAARPAKGGRA